MNRQKFGVANGVSSGKSLVSCGVPQGSKLGRLLFLIYVNDSPKCSDFSVGKYFSDDINLTFSAIK